MRIKYFFIISSALKTMLNIKIGRKQFSLGNLKAAVSDYIKAQTHFTIPSLFSFKQSLPPIITFISSQLYKQMVIYCIITRFQLLVHEKELDKEAMIYNFKLKNWYQELMYQKVISKDFEFEFLLVFFVKIVHHFIETHFEQVEIADTQQSEIFSLLIFTFIGVNMSAKSLNVIMKKYVEEDKSKSDIRSRPQRSSAIKSIHQNTDNLTNKLISIKTVKTIRSNKERRNDRLLKKSKHAGDRFSMRIYEERNELQDFKTTLKDQLKIIIPPKQKIKRINFGEIEKENQKYEIPLNSRRQQLEECFKLIDNFKTQKISSTLELQLAKKKLQHSYSKKNITIKNAYTRARLSHPQFSVSVENKSTHKSKEALPVIQTVIEKMETRQSKQTANRLTKTYWNTMIRYLKGKCMNMEICHHLDFK